MRAVGTTGRTWSVNGSAAAAGLALALLLVGVLTRGAADGPGAGGGRAPARSVPSLARWEANLKGRAAPGPAAAGPVSYAAALGRTGTLGNLDGENHYDPIRVFYEGRDYARERRDGGDRSWDPAPFEAAVSAAVHQYRDLYAVPFGCFIPGHHAFNTGLARHYVETGDPLSRDAALLMSARAPGSNDLSPLAAAQSFEGSREVAFSILMRLSAEDLGQAHRARTDEYARAAMGHIDQWTAARRPPCLFVRPFMVGLTLEALIAYWDRYRDPAVPPKIKTALDWLRANAWDRGHGGNPGTGTFVYTDIDVKRLPPQGCSGYSADPSDQRVPAPDLALLIAPAYAWYYQYSGDPTYRAWADEAWAGSAGASVVANQKTYNQSYRWSRKYLEWRARGDRPWPAAEALTLSAPDPAGGRANAPSAPFRVALSGAMRSAASPVLVTPSDGGAGGSFLPASFRLTTDHPSAVFRYRPARPAAGVTAVSVSNDAKLADPPPVNYAVRGEAPAATGYAVTGPSSGLVGRPARFTVALTPEGAVPPPPSAAAGLLDDGLFLVRIEGPPGRGTFSPFVAENASQVWLSADRPSMTFTYTPSAAGPRTLKASNEGGLADPPALNFSASKADPAYRPRPGDSALVSAPAGPDLVPVLADLAAYRVHAGAASAAGGRDRLEALRRAGSFRLVPGGSRVEVLRLLNGPPGGLAVEVRFLDGPAKGSTGLVPASHVVRPGGATAGAESPDPR